MQKRQKKERFETENIYKAIEFLSDTKIEYDYRIYGKKLTLLFSSIDANEFDALHDLKEYLLEEKMIDDTRSDWWYIAPKEGNLLLVRIDF